MANWNPKIPLNFRTVVLCLLAGMVLSEPMGAILPSRWQMYTPSSIALDFYKASCAICLFLFPGAICICFRCRWTTVAFVTVFHLMLLGLLFPAVS